jgi:hypothetical protein
MYFGSIKSFKTRQVLSDEGEVVAVAGFDKEGDERKMLTQFSTSPEIILLSFEIKSRLVRTGFLTKVGDTNKSIQIPETSKIWTNFCPVLEWSCFQMSGTIEMNQTRKYQ